jgi:cysteine desulfurase / selenocysteine lyase
MKNIRSDFLLFSAQPDYCYLDNAATTQKPKQVIDALSNFYTYHSAPVHRGIYTQAEEATHIYESARATIAQYIQADVHEIIFTKNTTESINLIASAWAVHNLHEGDEIIISELEHHSNILPWLILAQQKKLILKYIPITTDGLLDYTAYAQLLSKKVKLVACTALSNVLGSPIDITCIIKQAHACGAAVLLDAAQLAPHARINVHDLNVDFLVFSGHKMMGPTGIGVLYIKRDRQEQVAPYQVGGGMVYSLSACDAIWRNAPYKFEAGTPLIAQAIGFAAAIKYMQENIDFKELQKHEAQLCRLLIDGLSKIKAVNILGPVEHLRHSGHLVTFVINNMHAHDVAHYLNTHAIAVRAGNHCAQPLHKKLAIDSSVRASFYAYNTHEDAEKLLFYIQKLCGLN